MLDAELIFRTFLDMMCVLLSVCILTAVVFFSIEELLDLPRDILIRVLDHARQR